MTHAQETLARFENQTRTMSVATAAKKYKPAHEKEWSDPRAGVLHTYTFPDGSILHTIGRGKQHKIWCA